MNTEQAREPAGAVPLLSRGASSCSQPTVPAFATRAAICAPHRLVVWTKVPALLPNAPSRTHALWQRLRPNRDASSSGRPQLRERTHADSTSEPNQQSTPTSPQGETNGEKTCFLVCAFTSILIPCDHRLVALHLLGSQQTSHTD